MKSQKAKMKGNEGPKGQNKRRLKRIFGKGKIENFERKLQF